MSPEQAYEEICRAQKREGLFEQIQHLHGLGAHPDTLSREHEAAFKACQLSLHEVDL